MKKREQKAAFGQVATAGLILLVLVAFAVPASAQTAPPAHQPEGNRNASVTFDVKDKPIKDVVDYIRDKTNVNIIVSNNAEAEKVTLKVKDLPWRQTLELVADKTGCILVDVSPELIKVEKPPEVSFEFQDADIRKVISVIAAYSGANVVVGQEVQGTVTVKLNKVPWRDALDTVVKTLGFVVVEDKRNILRVTDPARLQQQLETRVYTFHYVRPPSPYEAYIKTEVQKENIKAPNADPEKDFNLLKAFRAAVAPEGTLEYVKSTNSIVVTGTAPKLDQLEKLIQQVDVEPAMVGVDIQFITTRDTDLLQVGVDPGDKGLQISNSLGSMVTRLPFTLGPGGWEDNLSAEGIVRPSGDVAGTGPEPIPAGSGFTFGTLDFTGVQNTLRLLKNDDSTRIVQAPRILTLDNQSATIFVGETIRYARTQAQSNQQGALTYSIDEATNSPVQTGFQLLVLPHVIPGKDEILMTVIPQQNSLTGTSTELPGFNIFKSGSGSSEVSIALPQQATSTVVTHMKLESGETAMIGGLLTDTDSVSRRRVPYLSDIPLIGQLFKYKSKSKSKDNLIILITPHILKSASERRKMLTEEMQAHTEQIRNEWAKIQGGDVKKLLPQKPEKK